MNHFPLAAIRYGIAALAVTATMLSGCTGSDTDDGVTPPASEKITITASTERRTLASGEVRTSLAANDEVLWSMDDTFVVYDMDSYNSSTFEIKSGAGTTSGVFAGYKPQGTSYIALYGDNSYGGGILTLPAEQTYDASGFAPYMNPMAAVTSDLESGLSFKNLMGILELNVTGTKTVESVTVSCDGVMLSGTVSVTPTTLDIVSYGTPSNSVSLVGINEALDPATARKFNVVVPPGTYENLKIRIVNTDGTSVLRTAVEPVVVERNQIVPVMGLVDGENAQESVVKLFIDEAQSSWYKVVVYSQKSADCSRFVYMFGTDEFVAGWKESNPGMSDRDMVLSVGSEYTDDISFEYEDHPNATYNFYALGYDADGNEDQLVHITYTMEVPYDASMSVTVEVLEENITETEALATFTPVGPVSSIKASLYQETDFGSAGIDSDQMFYMTNRYPSYQFEVSGSAVKQKITDLLPGRTYLLFYVGESTEGNFSQLGILEFTTKEHVESDAVVTITEASVEDVKASFNMVMSGSAVNYKALAITQDQYDYYISEGLGLADEIAALSQPAVSDPVYTVENLTPLSNYVMVAVAFDADGVYGPLAILPFTTQDYIPVQDPNYDLLLGDWMVSYTDYSTGEVLTDQYSVRIDPSVEGKTFLVTGLFQAGPGIPVQARFVNNGVCFDAGEVIANLENEEIRLALLSDNMIVPNGSYLGTYANDTLTFAGYNVAYRIDGLMFALYDPNGEYYTGSYYPPILSSLVFTKAKPSSAGSSTQQFDRVNPVTPSWQ